ncbi:hypothetical protein [Lentzea sp. NPDC060358]|uniref:hypothetical protein n=1 Tax=Lentzea sp. NPDC060358 TaxID=3347103 RepID=UPI0036626A26
MNKFWEHRYFRELAALNLPAGDFAVTGSGVLFAHGLIDDPHDLDVLSRGLAWQRVTQLAAPQPMPLTDGEQVVIGRLEFVDRWFADRWDVDELIDDADVLHGVRFVRLDVIRATKMMLGRPRDVEHLAQLEERARKK